MTHAQQSPAERLIEEIWDALEQERTEHTLAFTRRQIVGITRAADTDTRRYITALRACLTQAQERASK